MPYPAMTKIRVKREEKGWSQSKLAEQMCVSVNAVSHWELGKCLPTPSKLMKLAEIFDCSIEELLG